MRREAHAPPRHVELRPGGDAVEVGHVVDLLERHGSRGPGERERIACTRRRPRAARSRAVTPGCAPRSSTGHLPGAVGVWPTGTCGMPWRFFGPLPSGFASDDAGRRFHLAQEALAQAQPRRDDLLLRRNLAHGAGVSLAAVDVHAVLRPDAEHRERLEIRVVDLREAGFLRDRADRVLVPEHAQVGVVAQLLHVALAGEAVADGRAMEVRRERLASRACRPGRARSRTAAARAAAPRARAIAQSP